MIKTAKGNERKATADPWAPMEMMGEGGGMM